MSDRPATEGGLLRQPKAVWALAFSCVIAFMGLGLVDPILPAISHDLNASPSQVELLFTSYFAVTGVSMLVTGWVSSRIGVRSTLLLGLALIVAFSALAGASGSIGAIVGFRAGWGLGNALFIATALAAIVGAASGGVGGAIILYEAALGLGISTGPLLGGLLGGISWRGPFFGVAVLMTIGFVGLFALLDKTPPPAHHSSLADPFRALRDRGLLTMALTALFYNFGFFTMLGFTPFPMHLSAHGLGFVFCGWGILLAICSVFVAPRLQERFGTVPTMYVILALIAADLVAMGVFTDSQVALIVAVIVAGAFLGVNNTLVTQGVMRVAPIERGVASAAYSFVRFSGGAIAPWLAGKLSEWFDVHVPFYVGAAGVAIAIVVLFAGRSQLRRVDAGHEPAAPAPPPELAPARVVVAVDRDEDASAVIAAAVDAATARNAGLDVLHVHEVDVIGEDAVELTTDTEAEQILAARLAPLHDAGVDVVGEVVSSIGRHADVAQRIVEHAAGRRAELIVLGSSRYGHLAGALLGDVTDEVVRHASCEVLTVPVASNGRPATARDDGHTTLEERRP